MKIDKCGICNRIVDDERTAVPCPKDGAITLYHRSCISDLSTIKPCDDCNKYRLVCDDCKD